MNKKRRRPGRPPSEEGPRSVRYNVAFRPDEAEPIERVAGDAIADFIRTAAVEKAKRLISQDIRKNSKKK